MILFTGLVFYNLKNNIAPFSQGTIRMKLQLCCIVVVVLFYRCSISITNGTVISLSRLYSDKIALHYIAVENTQVKKIDDRLHKYFVTIKGLSGGEIIDINKWSTGELNVPFYPETRVFKNVCESFCTLGIEPGKLYFLEFQQPLRNQNFQRYTCDDLD